MHFDNVNSINLNDPEYFEILSGLWSGKKPPFTKAGVIRNTNFTASGEIDYSDVAWLDVETKQLAKRKLKYGDIIIERSGGGPKQPVGRVVQFRREDGIFSFSNFTTTVRVKKFDDLDPLFAFYILLELYQSGRTEDIQRRTTGLRNLDFKAYKERALFPLISRREQHHIAYMLSTVQTAIEQQERLIKLTRELKSALMHKLFTEGLHGEKQKMTEIGPVPVSWDVIELADMIEETEQVNMRTESERQIKYIDVSSISREHLLVENTAEYLLKEAPGRARKKVVTGDVIFATVRPTLLRVAYINKELNNQVCSTAFCVLRAKENVSDKYIYYVVQREQFIKQLAAIESGANYPAVTDRQVKNQKIPKPEYDEQVKIAEILDTCDRQLLHHAKKREVFEELFRALLNQLITGQVRVNDIDIKVGA